MAPPGRFIASQAAPPRDPVLDDPATVEDARALVRLGGGAGARELLIATELGGGLRVVACDRERLPQRVRTQLAFHEVAAGRSIELAANELYVLDVQALEMLPDAPGPNDALYLYGALRGPYPALLGKPAASVEGQLTVTRADLLGGLIDGVASAFAYAPEPRGSRCVHALLPGERADAIEAGRGIVLALPLAPAWTLDPVVPNDLVVAQMVHDVLGALRGDLGVADEPPLPVPSRAALEAQLVAAGWRIEGDAAVRARGRGMLGAVFGGSERRALPREGTLDELIAEARACLARMPGIPSAEALALQRRAGRRPLVLRPPTTPPQPPQPPARPAPPQPPRPRPRVETPRSDWMKDFVEAHRSPARPRPKVTAPARAVAPEATPAWMADFGEPDEPADAPADAPADEPKPPRDWSEDFD